MRKILIDQRIKAIGESYKKALQTVIQYHDGRQNHNIQPLKRLKDLKKCFEKGAVVEVLGPATKNPPTDCKEFASYIDAIISEYPKNLLIKAADEIEDFNNTINNNLSNINRLSAILSVKGKKAKPFHQIIVETMQYDLVRRAVLPKYIREVGVKTCVYCNANYTVTGVDGHGFYDVDHWRPKSKYPWACLTFFNLQPACHTCNQLKNDDDSLDYFGLYEKDGAKSLDILHFEIDSDGLSDFIIRHDSRNMKIRLAAYNSSDNAIKDKHNEKLLIEEIYGEHHDIVQEAVWRKLSSNESWRKSIKESFGSLELSENDIDRYIYGNYIDHGETHKRPLSRLVQDIIEMDLSELEYEQIIKDSLLPEHIEVGDFYRIEESVIIKIKVNHYDYFECSDGDTHSIDELQPLDWVCLDLFSLDQTEIGVALKFAFDKIYGNKTPAHIVQNRVRSKYGVELNLDASIVSDLGYEIK